MASGAALDRTFGVRARGSSIRTEIVGGATTFLAMAYILGLNPAILDPGGSRLPALVTSTALAAGVVTILMGLLGRQPLALAAGLGLNTFVAATLVQGFGMPLAAAMGVVVIEGVVVGLLVLTGLRERLLAAVPMALKRAMAAGIGLFIAVIGLRGAGIVTASGLGENLWGWRTFVFAVGLALIVTLMVRRTKGALAIGILSATALAVVVNTLAAGAIWGPVVARLPRSLVAAPDFSLVGAVRFDIAAFVPFATAIALVLALMLADFFDSVGSIVGVTSLSGAMSDDGTVPGIKRILLVDSLGAVAGGLTSSSSATTFIESAAGVSDGARTGLASLVTGALFLLAMFFSPVVSVIPPEATGAALVVVGFLMTRFVAEIPWRDPGIGVPALLTMVLMPLTNSIANGIGAGFIAYVALAVLRGRALRVHWLLYVVSAVFVWYFAKGLIA
jgi:AGZA family xanthine/uracil permease-like MFS transporter